LFHGCFLISVCKLNEKVPIRVSFAELFEADAAWKDNLCFIFVCVFMRII
jgi:hypothetical protein